MRVLGTIEHSLDGYYFLLVLQPSFFETPLWLGVQYLLPSIVLVLF